MIDRPWPGRKSGYERGAPFWATLVIWLLTAAVLAAVGAYLVVVQRNPGTPVTVSVDERIETVRTTQASAGELLAELGLVLQPEDFLSIAPETPISEGLRIEIVRARPALVATDGALYEVRTRGETIGDVLGATGLRLSPADEVLLDGELVGEDTALPPVEWVEPAIRRQRHAWDAQAAPMHLSVRRAVPITVDDGSVPYEIFTTAPTVGEALTREKLDLYLGDKVQPGLGAAVTPGLRVYIERSKPVIVTADGRSVQTRTRGTTVGGTLMELGVLVAGNDRVEPALHEEITEHLPIKIVRVSEVTLVEREAIPYESIMVGDDELEIDQQRLAQEGKPGEFRRRWQVVYEDGQETARQLLDEWVAAQPVTRKLAYGRKIVSRTIDTPEGTLSYWRKVRMYAASYSPARSGTPRSAPWYGRTRIGLTMRKGIVAVDPKLIPLTSYVYVPGYGKAIAGDTGGGVRGKLIDLGYSDDDYVGWHWWVDVYYLDPPPARNKIMWVLPNYPPPSKGGGRSAPR